jgi:hypothetical protein
MIRKDLDITIHQVILCKLIFAVYDLTPLTLRQRQSARPWLYQHAINTTPASLKRLKIRLGFTVLHLQNAMLTAIVLPVQVLMAGPHLCTSPSPPLPVDSTHADSFPPARALNIG